MSYDAMIRLCFGTSDWSLYEYICIERERREREREKGRRKREDGRERCVTI